jgi:hypothetical protein
MVACQAKLEEGRLAGTIAWVDFNNELVGGHCCMNLLCFFVCTNLHAVQHTSREHRFIPWQDVRYKSMYANHAELVTRAFEMLMAVDGDRTPHQKARTGDIYNLKKHAIERIRVDDDKVLTSRTGKMVQPSFVRTLISSDA